MSRNFNNWPLLILLTLVSLPAAAMYLSLIIDTVTETPPGALMPTGFTLSNWRFLLDPELWRATFYSLVFGFSCVIIVLTVSSTAGYALSRLNMPFRKLFLAGLIVMHGFPSASLIIGVFLVLQYLGLYDSLIGIMAVRATMTLPFGIWIMKGFYDAVPWEIEMAGLQDGASRFTVWRRLILPQIKPGLIALGVFAFIDGWNEFVLPRVLAPSTDFQVLSVYLQALSDDANIDFDFNLFKTVGLYYTLPILLMFVIFQNRMMNIFSGGTKG